MAIDYKKIGRKIKALRMKKNLSQEKLAELCGLSSSYISYIETGKKKISLSKLEVLSDYLNFNVDIIDSTTSTKKQEFLNRLISFISTEFETFPLDW